MALTYEPARCPVCDWSAGALIADDDGIRDEVERLWAFHGRRLTPVVPPEHLVDRVAFSQHPPRRVVQCERCGHVFRNPWERREALVAAYSQQALSECVMQMLFETQRAAYAAQARRLVRIAGPRGRGLEVGSYVGGFLAAARDRGWFFEGVDLSASAASFAAREGFTVVQGEIDAVDGSRPYDAVAIWNTFEQLYDARHALVEARARLRPGGVLVLRVPNGHFYVAWRARLRGAYGGAAVRLLAHNNLLSFPYRQAFSRASLSRLLGDSGFTVVRTYGDTLVPIADRWTTRFGAVEERIVKWAERLAHRGWRAPWVEVYARIAHGRAGTL